MPIQAKTRRIFLLGLGSASALREVDHSDSEDNHMAHNKKKARIYSRIYSSPAL